MTSTITDTRRAVGWSMRDLALNLGVNVSTVSRMETSEREGTIKVGTLQRALEVMGRSLRVDAVNNRREERVAFELHRVLAKKLRSNPGPMLDVVPGNLQRLRESVRGPHNEQWVERWAELTTGPLDDLISEMLADTPLGRELRQNSPFAGALTQDERLNAIRAASRT